MSNNSGTTLIPDQSSTATDESNNSLKNKKTSTNNGNLPNVQSTLLDKILDDPEMKEVVVMEVYISNWIK